MVIDPSLRTNMLNEHFLILINMYAFESTLYKKRVLQNAFR